MFLSLKFSSCLLGTSINRRSSELSSSCFKSKVLQVSKRLFCSLMLTEQRNRESVFGCKSARWVCWVQKQIYSLKWRFLWCGKFHVVSVTLLKVRTVRLAFQKRFLVLSVCFLRRWLFQVVSLSSRFETTPDLNASKHIKFVVRKV